MTLIINEELGNILNYCAANMLSINFKKTNYMIIASPKKKNSTSITTCNIEQTSQIIYLGVFIDEHLKWDAQLPQINNKLTKHVGVLFKLRHYMPINALKQLYYTLIFPYLNYGLTSWGTACQTKLSKIKVSQNNCLWYIFFANKVERPAPYFTLLGILKLKSIFKLKIAGLVHKIQFKKKRKHLLLSMIWLNLLPQLIIAPDMP